MNIEKIYFGKCDDYKLEKIEKQISSCFSYLNINLPTNCNVLIKPNVLGAYEPEMHITTHPVVIEAVVRLLLDNNNIITIGDSSGNGQFGQTRKALEKCGISRLSKKYDVNVISFDKYGSVNFVNNSNKILKEVNLTSFINNSDCIINMPKLKSHQLMRYTGAVKNLFGCVPGAGKLNCHINASNPKKFAELLLDIYSFIKDKILINIIDGIIGIEGPGPGPAGKKKYAGIIAASGDALALDMACTQAIGTPPIDVYTNKEGVNRGYFNGHFESNIEPDIEKFRLPKPAFIAGPLHKILPKFALSKPFVEPEKCKICGLCKKACPGKAISFNKYPVFDYSKCIYCYCCHENCPEAAIKLKEGIILKIFKAFSK